MDLYIYVVLVYYIDFWLIPVRFGDGVPGPANRSTNRSVPGVPEATNPSGSKPLPEGSVLPNIPITQHIVPQVCWR